MALNVELDMTVEEPSEIDMAVTQEVDNISFELGAEAIAVKNHAVLENRDMADQHPISAITGLANILSTIPTKTSQLSNDSGYVKATDIPTVPTKTSQLQNDSGYITSSAIPTVPTKTSDLTNDSGYITSADIPSVPVQSVNGKTGTVVLSASDVGALPSSTTIPTKTSQLTNDSGYITDAGVTSFNGSTGAVTYTAPVTSVNGQTGAVTVTEGLTPLTGTTEEITPTQVHDAIIYGNAIEIVHIDNTFGVLRFTNFNEASAFNLIVGNTIISYNGMLVCYALFGSLNGDEWSAQYYQLAQITNIPTKTSDLTNDSGYITSVPVTSVNSKTGAVVLSASDVSAIGTSALVTSVSASSTNSQVPSAKCLYDLVGNVETLLASI